MAWIRAIGEVRSDLYFTGARVARIDMHVYVSGAELKISTLRRGSKVIVKVTNSAPSGSGQPGHGLALVNVRERLFLLHDVQAQFRTAFRDGVFQVRLEVPA